MDADSTRERGDNVDWNSPIWSREAPTRFWDPGRKLLKSLRDYQRIRDNGGPLRRLRSALCVLRHRFWSAVSGAEIDLSCNIGGGLLIPHPNGIVIHPDSRVGVNCLIFQQVTLAGGPQLGNHVDIGAGAKVLGNLSIGNNVRIGANAVVTRDVADGLTVAGIPARVIGESPND